jgi:hypothetical protein
VLLQIPKLISNVGEKLLLIFSVYSVIDIMQVEMNPISFDVEIGTWKLKKCKMPQVETEF